MMSAFRKRIFRRKIYDELVRWKKEDSSRYAILIEGVRRVGKSTVAKEFAANKFRSYLLIDFMEAPDTVKNMFNRFSDDPDRLFRLLSGYYNVRLYDRESLIIFDEVQEFPRAHQLVKYLVEYGKYPILETGSLITLKMHSKATLPSEVMTVPMNPMDFEEFMWACGKDAQLDLIREAFHKREPMDESLHADLMETFRTYMITGGMPQSVSALLETNSFQEVEKAKKLIIDLYRNDIWRENDGILAELFDSIPSMLNRTSKTFSPGTVREGTKTERYSKRISWLCGSRMVNPCYSCVNPDPAIRQFEDRSSLKMYFVDTGLLLTMMLEANIANRDEIFGAIIKGELSMNRGMLFENMVAQTLVASGRNLDFCLFDSDESDRTQELDFILADSGRIVPIEVKSSRIRPHKSLDRFMKKYSAEIDMGYIVSTKNLTEWPGIMNIPIYMAWLIRSHIRMRNPQPADTPEAYR